ncbi:radical SAM protein [Achromobacter xylosoxidans]|uniref:radical SAM protein n=1 Tax=Alcaligenes xylosoxydans xylosoxydans TaxID=85698 RepID=UPI000B48AF36|nr:radical SAM protein [Achromobacter xylosoxidans]
MQNIEDIRNPEFRFYARRYADIESRVIDTIESYGIEFDRDDGVAAAQCLALKAALAAKGAVISNSGHSVHVNWLSPACVACRTGEGSYTTFASLKCHRDCYFCFNPNQEHYKFYQDHIRNLRRDAAAICESETPLKYVAVTGGEPLMHKAETVSFFGEIHRRCPSTHTRLYTTGDHFGRSTAVELQQSGLKEIRFSIKIDDPPDRQRRTLDRIALAKEYIPAVMVEMPVEPGSLLAMEHLFDEFERIGLDGINLLELCFPLTNAPAFRARGLLLKYPPYEVFYNYWYAGGLAIAGSEELCLTLMLRALEKRQRFGMHYCSLANKHTGQVFQQNENAEAGPLMHRSQRDFFFKSAKIFGAGAVRVTRNILQKEGWPFRMDDQQSSIEFDPKAICALRNPDQEVCVAYFVAEEDETGQSVLVEVKLHRTTPGTFSRGDL